MQKSNENNIFINGKKQVLEMMQYFTDEEKTKLIKNIRPRNPQLASELQDQGITFGHIRRLGDSDLYNLARNVQAPIMGIALKEMDEEFLRRFLRLVPRDYAESVFEMFQTTLPNERLDVKRAQDRVLDALLGILKKRRTQQAQA